MSLAADTATAAWRAAAVGALATAAAWPLRHAWTTRAARPALLAAMVLVVAALPPLAVSYAWVEFAPRMFLSETAAPWCLLALLLARALVPVALVLALVPEPAFSGTAAHLVDTAPPTSRLGSRLRRLHWHAAHGAGAVAALGIAAGFLTTFADFELTARLAQASWTVRVFDAQAGGASLGAALRACSAPLALSAAVLAAGLLLARRPCRSVRRRAPQRTSARRFAALGVAGLLLVAFPFALLAVDGAMHIADALRPHAVRVELLWSIVYASAAVLGATAIAAAARGRLRLALCLPGLGGGLTLALATRAVCPAALLETPLPAAAALTLWLLPWAVLLHLALRPGDLDASLHTARLLAPLDAERARVGARLGRALRGQRRIWATALLFPLALQDVVIGSVLAPPQATPLAVRLHNLAHYGHSHTLSALLVVGAGVGGLATLVAALAGASSSATPRRRTGAALP